MTVNAEIAKEAKALVEQLMPLMAGKSPVVQGVALAELVATHIAGHTTHIAGHTLVGADNVAGKKTLWMDLLKAHATIVAVLLAGMHGGGSVPEGEEWSKKN